MALALVGSVFAVYAVQKLPLIGSSRHPSSALTSFQWAWPALQTPLVPTDDTPEGWLREVYAHLSQGRADLATDLAAQMTEKFPSFQLGQLLYAELLNSGLTQPWSEADLGILSDPAHRLQFHHLLREAELRLGSPPRPWFEHKIPAGVHRLSPQITQLIVVDARHSRLYWFANRSDPNGPPELALLLDTYVSVGANGVGKTHEGDLRTPVGVYAIQRLLEGRSLPDFYGSGALVLDYPNAMDQMLGRTGSGIWLHGTPSDQFSRPPQSTEGCVVLSNPALSQLLRQTDLKGTRVMIVPQLDWIDQKQAAVQDAEFEAALQSHLMSPSVTQAAKTSRPPLALVSVLGWKDQDEWREVVAQEVDPLAHKKGPAQWVKTYWRRETDGWRMIYGRP